MTAALPWNKKTLCTAFVGPKNIASGELAHVVRKVAGEMEAGVGGDILIFDDHTSRIIEVEFRGLPEHIIKGLPNPEPLEVEAGDKLDEKEARGRGRPKLGVIPREVTLLPRHWEWLSTQSGGASVALRKLVDEARRANEGGDRIRQAGEAAYKFMHAMAGSEAGFEEAARALFAGDQTRFEERVRSWPVDVRDHLRKLAAAAFPARS